ncbi:MAG: histidine kinase [Ignavibacteriales bacterium CG12_big_fil_rev_8_21_14_0_65_30_8]|nr:MAG: histidine kinase [Ignavibacteriales bacterium CG12_big_fil_rev_8_21_14_0_65_30_8]
MVLFIMAIIVFIIVDLLIRFFAKEIAAKKRFQERQNALKESYNLNFSSEAKTLKRAEVENPKARILCVDDEPVILDSFRKILVLDGYCVDTVETGQEALGLIRNHSYDFVFTDLKMPAMSGLDVTKSVKHIRPDIDVVIITGYATVETAVDCMKYGAMDYVQKPFTEDELLKFTKELLIKRQDKIQRLLKPKVHITHLEESAVGTPEFLIPGGVFISEGHCWCSINEEGIAKIGIDDFAKKLIGKIDAIEYPNIGMDVKKGDSLFIVKQKDNNITFKAPLSGRVNIINNFLDKDLDALNYTSYGDNWICGIDTEELDNELALLKVGKAAVSFFQGEIEKLQGLKKKLSTSKDMYSYHLHVGEMENVDNTSWNKYKETFFEH